MSTKQNGEFDIRGVNHLALVCKDMQKTVEFYRDILGMPLITGFELPGGRGQHFFFDCGNGDCLAFFWFPNAPEAAPGIAAPAATPRVGDWITAHGSMNHIAFNIPPEKFDEAVEKLKAKGIPISPVSNHDRSETQLSADNTDDVYIRSVYFQGPDGECLEFAAWTRPLRESETGHPRPRTASERTPVAA
ncbi:MAG: VOC family protein [Sphingomonadales bacterium]|nr:VOC family protein [Sphingomonadales bacterium]MDE2569711.1 VOC family protein [Sphingomonadales bacterium]